MNDLDDLYQEMILDHSKRPRNFLAMEDATGQANGHNPLCGDRVTIFVKLAEGKIDSVSFTGAGCAISTASASILTEVLRGKTPQEAEAIFDLFHDLVTGKTHQLPGDPTLAKLEVFSGVSEFPVRVKCASLAWHTLIAALKAGPNIVTTE
jgi:nitrogen fixation NifU-like protein